MVVGVAIPARYHRAAATQEKKGRLATGTTFSAPVPYLLTKSDGHALRFIGTGNLEFFDIFAVPGLSVPPNALVGYTTFIIDQDGRDSRWDIIRERDG